MQMKTLWVAGFVLSLAAPSRAETPDAREVLSQAEAAIRAVKAVRYKAHGEAQGALAARMAKMDGTLTLVPIPGADIPKVRVDAQVIPPQQSTAVAFQLAADGQQISVAEHGSRTFVQRDLISGASLLNNVSVLFIREFGLEQPFAREAKAASLTYVGVETVEGVECDVIHAVLNPSGDEVRWFFGKTDHLPRRVQRVSPSPIGQTTITTSLTSLETLSGAEEEQFRLAKPDGFRDPTAGGGPGRDPLLEVGSAAPEWTLKDAEGKEVSLKSLRGKLVLLDFWATWCGPCRQAMPSVQKLYEKYKARPVAVFGVNCYERGPNVDPVGFMKKGGFTYPQLLQGSDVARTYKAVGIPTFYLIAPDGKILLAFSGFSASGEQQLEATIERELAKLSGGVAG
jgi:thiol-disulfide isomerase/thioredoxin